MKLNKAHERLLYRVIIGVKGKMLIKLLSTSFAYNFQFNRRIENSIQHEFQLKIICPTTDLLLT